MQYIYGILKNRCSENFNFPRRKTNTSEGNRKFSDRQVVLRGVWPGSPIREKSWVQQGRFFEEREGLL